MRDCQRVSRMVPELFGLQEFKGYEKAGSYRVFEDTRGSMTVQIISASSRRFLV